MSDALRWVAVAYLVSRWFNALYLRGYERGYEAGVDDLASAMVEGARDE